MSVAKSLSLFKQIMSELKLANKGVSFGGKSIGSLQGQLPTYLSTGKLFGKSSKELEHIGESYVTYLRSTRLLGELQDRYRGREKSIEESARLVGLEIPKKKY